MNAPFCQASQAIISSCCNNATQVTSGVFQCNFGTTDGITKCLSSIQRSQNGTVGVSCSSQTTPNSASHRSNMSRFTVLLMSCLVALCLATTASASPTPPSSVAAMAHSNGRSGSPPVNILAAEGQCQCTSCGSQSPALEIGYYSDPNCQDFINTVTYFAYDGAGSGCASCTPSNFNTLGSPANVYGKVAKCYGDCTAQVAITRDQLCPPGGASAVIGTFDAGSEVCVGLHGLNGGEGAAVYRIGGAPFARRDLDDADELILDKRDESCSGFNIEKRQNAYSATVQVSDIVNCEDSASPCTISTGIQHTKSLSSSYSFSAGGDVFGITASTTFGTDYTESTTTTIQDTFSVPANQEGYLSAYSLATLFTGTYTGCKGGDKPGTALALKKNSVVYQLVVTNA